MAYKHILHIDDDLEDCEIFGQALIHMSYVGKHTCISNPVEALRKLTTGILAPDLIFLDLNMPAMDGFVFLENIKEIPQIRQIPVLILSASPQQAYINRTRNLGAQDYLIKPKVLSELVLMLSSIL